MSYDRYPETSVEGFDSEACEGAQAVRERLAQIGRDVRVLTVECYPGVDEEVFRLVRDAFRPDVVVRGEDVFFDGDTLTRMMRPHLTDDRVRGVMFYGRMEDFVDQEVLLAARAAIPATGRVLVYGVGASLVSRGDALVYCDLARWEITLRYRAGMPNFKQQNGGEDPLRKIKRGYFVEWRIADKRKAALLGDIDWLLDSNERGCPRLVSGEGLRAGLRAVARRPFRLVPYFDPGVWGGQWMREVCGLDKDAPNYAWAFDGVPEENSLYLRFGEVRVEVPAMDLVLFQPVELLGMRNYCRFGAEFPIRFDFLDTMGGQNLSLQVHPMTEYIRSHFGMAYTQDESYYILDAAPDGAVYLGLRDGVDPAEMERDLRRAQEGGPAFPVERYVNRFPARRHDHFLIPAGTPHCSAANTMVLEISATPYNFTFKLWDWDRVGFDGLPRPIHIDDGMRNIQWGRTTAWVRENLVNACEVVQEGEGFREEHTGLHELEFIETRRLTASRATEHDASEGVNVLNLVEGEAAVVESPEGSFEPLTVHYAETFIVPAACGRYTMRPERAGDTIVFVKAFVRQR
ncbi:class I mannose-6-phosphate isomerase [Olsenella profusa]|uniref:Class I mannose-6-phosphate isomerase n=1 Tax=Olsenella profusa TaxID=138595 RepID=A0ABS2EZR9_9ACTN|nr:class I mannose-6-phosphate isomerase [Olsenella profusa]MBM6774073.1 class I mannose-6-phosphate isomerase [Olsenella profusa]